MKRRPTGQLEKPKPVKVGQGGEGEHAWAPEAHGPAEHEAKEVAHQQAATEHLEDQETQEAREELHHDGEQQAQRPGQPAKPTQGPRLGPQKLQQAPDSKAQALQREQAAPAENRQSKASAATYAALGRVGAAQAARLTGTSARLERPPDAFTLLKEARERGVLFTEDAAQEGHREDQEDPELAAAVEDAIAMLFGVKGILRVGPGKDDQAAPIIVVVATHGFGEASMARVPEKVHRFPTTVAIPFELLPLRRER